MEEELVWLCPASFPSVRVVAVMVTLAAFPASSLDLPIAVGTAVTTAVDRSHVFLINELIGWWGRSYSVLYLFFSQLHIRFFLEMSSVG